MIDHDNCIFEDKYATNISLDIFKKVLVPGLCHNDSHANIQCIFELTGETLLSYTDEFTESMHSDAQ